MLNDNKERRAQLLHPHNLHFISHQKIEDCRTEVTISNFRSGPLEAIDGARDIETLQVRDNKEVLLCFYSSALFLGQSMPTEWWFLWHSPNKKIAFSPGREASPAKGTSTLPPFLLPSLEYCQIAPQFATAQLYS